MNKNDAKAAVLNAWDEYSNDPDIPDVDKFRQFFHWLSKEKPECLTWRIAPGEDQWQTVRGWLNVRSNYGKK